MAKVKTYCVEITVTRKVLLFVDARRPQGAIEKLKTQEGWAEATKYEYDEGGIIPPVFDPKWVTIGEPKQMND